ncbi:MAG: hypothetical protein QOH68_3714, partial [Nocardioidaceae bacterium]|nr:hypothetical protein [Nocardioidaceae bacterium]
EAAYLCAQRLLAEVQSTGSVGEVQLLGEHLEGAKLSQFQIHKIRL